MSTSVLQSWLFPATSNSSPDSCRSPPEARLHLRPLWPMHSGDPVRRLLSYGGRVTASYTDHRCEHVSRPPTDTVPAPVADGGTAWKGAFARASAIVAQMTTEEKLTFVSGQDGRCASNTLAIERLDLPSICFLDGPTGPRFATGVTQVSDISMIRWPQYPC